MRQITKISIKDTEYQIIDDTALHEADLPTALPNPKKVMFTGAVTGVYDGSQELTLNIPSVPKSAYEYAQDGGYLGTETEFAEQLAYLMGSTLVGKIDENNIITVMGNLPAGTYMLKYENIDGTTIDMGVINIGDNGDSGEDGDEKVPVNQIPISTDENDDLLVGENGEKGYLTNSRISSSDTTGTVQTQAECEVTGFIPFKNGEVLRGNAYIFSNIGNDGSTAFANTTSYNNITCFDSNKKRVGSVKWDLRNGNTVAGLTVNADSSFIFDSTVNGTVPADTALIRVSLINITDNSVLTVD